MALNMAKTPFPWPGGKSDAAAHVWRLIGDVPHYVEPFAGTLAVLLRRPHKANRTYCSETVNDADGLLINFWRSVQWSPDATADAASWPVTEADKTARSCWVLRQAQELDLDRLMGDPHWHDPVLAGWWAWCVCCTIGSFGMGGPWWPDADGVLRNTGKRGVSRGLPHLGDDGRGVNRPQLREPGVSRELPHLGNDGRGVNRPQLREPGVGQTPDFHPTTMPQLTAWLHYLSARLRHVRIINGDWRRSVGNGAALTLPVRQGKGPAGVLLDPPYADDNSDAYRGALHDRNIPIECAEWAVTAGDDPKWRIVACGYDGDAAEPIYLNAGWTAIDWHTDGWLTSGYGNQSHRERLYASPHCLTADPPQAPLFEMEHSL